MNKVKKFLVRFFKNFLAEMVDDLLDEATLEINQEVDGRFNAEEAALIKLMLPRLRSKVILMIKEKI